MRDSENSNSSFLFGIIIGAIIGAVIAIVIYKNNKTEIFDNLRSRFDDLLKKYTSQPTPQKPKSKKKIIAQKIKVTLPKSVETVSLAPVKTIKPKKMFKN